ncbi:MAG TPA: hypothetical protein VFS59_01715 [Gemmatimonadaceae bacterium]|nr:hypothetical protein [Gemmatimonadaceae bacterium]
MPREPYERPVPQPSASPEGLPRTTHVDYLLRFVLDRSTSGARGIGGRLDALERTLVALTRPWRAETPLAPARELRVSSETLDTLLAWLERDERPEARDLERLGVYVSGAVTDRSVPDGWLRIRLAS